jgi:transcriptional regulator with XRE-family HTH domain/predicted RNA binding protein YcfA (HicA-like mRNA interferase family)
MPDVRYPELEAAIKKAGWVLVRDHGTHRVFKKDERTERLALGGSQTMGGGGLKEIYKRFGIEPVKKQGRGGKRVVTAPESGTFGRRIYDARTKAGMSQNSLAKAIGFNQATVSSWERNDSSPFNENVEIHYKTMREPLRKMAELFGWEDIRLKAGYTAVPPKKDEQKLPPKEEESKPIPNAKERMGHQASTFISLIRPDDVKEAMEAYEKQIADLERELKRIRRSDIGLLRQKADLYDKMLEDVAALLKSAEVTEE